MGEAILFVAPRERRMLRAIEHAARQAIEPMKMLEHRRTSTQHRLAKFKERIRETMMGEEPRDLLQPGERADRRGFRAGAGCRWPSWCRATSRCCWTTPSDPLLERRQRSEVAERREFNDRGGRDFGNH